MSRRPPFQNNIALIFVLGLGACAPHRFFYYPNRKLYAEPAAFKVNYDMVQYPSANGKQLWAIFMKTDQAPKGTVIHFHGNFGNLSNHFPLAVFLVKNGFDVLAFDYQGYGASQGHPSPKNVVEDGIATVRYAQAHLRDPKTGVVIFGQSLGGAAAVVVAARETDVKAAVIESAFTSYSRMGKDVLQRSAWTWLLSYVVPLMVSHRYDPIDHVAQISPRPVFFIHGDKDQIVPVHMSQDLYLKAREPKTLWILEGRDHLECRKVGRPYTQAIVDFFTQSLDAAGPTNTSTH